MINESRTKQLSESSDCGCCHCHHCCCQPTGTNTHWHQHPEACGQLRAGWFHAAAPSWDASRSGGRGPRRFAATAILGCTRLCLWGCRSRYGWGRARPSLPLFLEGYRTVHVHPCRSQLPLYLDPVSVTRCPALSTVLHRQKDSRVLLIFLLYKFFGYILELQLSQLIKL